MLADRDFLKSNQRFITFNSSVTCSSQDELTFRRCSQNADSKLLKDIFSIYEKYNKKQKS